MPVNIKSWLQMYTSNVTTFELRLKRSLCYFYIIIVLLQHARERSLLTVYRSRRNTVTVVFRLYCPICNMKYKLHMPTYLFIYYISTVKTISIYLFKEVAGIFTFHFPSSRAQGLWEKLIKKVKEQANRCLER